MTTATRTPMTDAEKTDRAAKRAERKREVAERAASMEASFVAARAIVATRKCPHCGSGLRRNLSLTGWWQCEQYGSPTFRARPSEPGCGWQTFTE